MPHYAGNLRDFVKNPRYATALGLLLDGVGQRQRGSKEQPMSLGQVFGRMKAWFARNL